MLARTTSAGGSRSPKYGHRVLASFGGREGRGMHDHHEHAFHPAPCCPSCGEAMRRFVRLIPKIGGLTELETFKCRACEVWIAEACEPKILNVAALRSIS